MAITIRATTIAGAIVLAAVLVGVAGQSPAAAPGPMVAEVPMAGEAPGPAGVDCFSYLVNMSDCLTYVEAGSNTTAPDKGCCPELAGLVESQPICLCQLLSTNTTASLGVQIDRTKALKLPSVCGVETPPPSTCSLLGYPVGVPMPSEAPSTPGAGMSPESGNRGNGASGIAVSILVGLAAFAFLTTPHH